MELNLIYGKIQSGKSTYIYKKIDELIQRKREDETLFNKIYVVTPEQFSFLTEKKLLEYSNGAIVDIEVLTFSRMADRINQSHEEITLSAKAMIIYSILLKNKSKLKLLDKSNENISIAINAIDEFKKHNIMLEDLEVLISKCDKTILKPKLEDLYLIYSNYEQIIKNTYVDSYDKLNFLAKSKELEKFKDSYIFIDEFNGFTSSELKLIKSLILNSKQVNIVFAIDNTNTFTNPDLDIYYDNKQIFSKTIEYLKSNGIDNIKKIPISKDLNNIDYNGLENFKYNFESKSLEIDFLQDHLFDISQIKYESDVKDIRIAETSNFYEQIEYIAKTIVNLVRNEKYRYKDIAIAIDNIEENSSIIKGIFSKYEIPLFIDDKKQLNQNNVTQFILSILEVINTKFSSSSILNLLKINLLKTKIENKHIYILENYIKKWDLNYSKWKKPIENKYEDYEIVKICEDIRKQIIEPLVILDKKLNENNNVSEILEHLYDYIEKNELEKNIINKIDEYEKDGLIELSNDYKRSYQIILDLLDQIYIIFKDEKLSIENLYNILKIGLENSKFASLPSTLDQVVIGDIRRSKRNNIKCLFAINCNDGQMPHIIRQEGFLNDNDRNFFKNNNLEIAKGTLENIYEANFNIYRVITTPSDKLFLSYLTTTKDGKPAMPCNIINKIRMIFPKLKTNYISQTFNDNFEINTKISYENLISYISYLSGITNLRLKDLAQEIKNSKDEDKLDKKQSELLDFSQLIPQIIIKTYNILKQNKLLDISNKDISAIFFENYAFNLTKDTINNLYHSNIQTSISKLEKYMTCPFSYFMQYNLLINVASKQKIEKFDTGTFMHEVVEKFFSNVKFMTRNSEFENEKHFLQFLEKDMMNNMIDKIVDQKLIEEKNYKFKINSNSKALQKRLKSILRNSIELIIEQLLQSDFYIYKQEANFETGKEYKPIEIKLDNNHKFELVGKIDRIDVDTKYNKYVRIIDYKSSKKNIDLNEVYAGKSLQLFTYLDAICKNEDYESCGVLYFPLIEEKIDKDDQRQDSYKMTGYVLDDIDILNMQDNNLESGTKSKIIPVSILKSGQISKGRSNILSREDFEVIKQFIPKKIYEIGNKMLDGNIEISPLKSKKFDSCMLCKYNEICNFDPSYEGNLEKKITNKQDDNIIMEMKKQIDNENEDEQ